MVLHDTPGQLRAPKNTWWVDYVLLKPDAGSTVLFSLLLDLKIFIIV